MSVVYDACVCVCVRACVRACVCVVVVHWHCSAQLSMFNMEKRYRNKIIIIIIIIMAEIFEGSTLIEGIKEGEFDSGEGEIKGM